MKLGLGKIRDVLKTGSGAAREKRACKREK